MMKIALIIAALLSVVLTTPTPLGVRNELRRESGPLASSLSFLPETLDLYSRDQKPKYFSNWAGAVLTGGGNYSEITGTIIVPQPKMPSGSNDQTTYSTGIWVGIDGYACKGALLQTGISIHIKNNVPSYTAWHEWFPQGIRRFSNINVKAGDQIRMGIRATSDVSGVATIDNLSNNEHVSFTFTHEASLGTLCEAAAEWIVEDIKGKNGLVPYADFGSVKFSNAEATQAGKTVTPEQAQILYMAQHGKVLAKCSSSANDVTCNYTGQIVLNLAIIHLGGYS